MDEETDSDSDSSGCYYRDIEELILEPDRDLKATTNPSVPSLVLTKFKPIPFLFRGIQEDNEGEYSTLVSTSLKDPTHTTRIFKIIMGPNESYASRGREDPRITLIDDTYYITHTVFNGKNSRICIAETKNFERVEEKILIPGITLEEAVANVGDTEIQKEWEQELRGYVDEYGKEEGKKLLVSDKDASLEYFPEIKKFGLPHRWGRDIQISLADKLEDYQDKDYWIQQLKNIKLSTIIKANKSWCKDKVGLGPPLLHINGRCIGIYHGVNAINNTAKEKYVYGYSFFEIDPNNPTRLLSIIDHPFVLPDQEKYISRFTDKSGREIEKDVIFPSGWLIEGLVIYIYYGFKDMNAGVRSISLPWLLKDLSSNRIAACSHS